MLTPNPPAFAAAGSDDEQHPYFPQQSSVPTWRHPGHHPPLSIDLPTYHHGQYDAGAATWSYSAQYDAVPAVTPYYPSAAPEYYPADFVTGFGPGTPASQWLDLQPRPTAHALSQAGSTTTPSPISASSAYSLGPLPVPAPPPMHPPPLGSARGPPSYPPSPTTSSALAGALRLPTPPSPSPHDVPYFLPQPGGGNPPPVQFHHHEPAASAGGKRKAAAPAKKLPAMACLFCRGRKIACGGPVSPPDRTCNQCARRSLSCAYPAESHRGLRRRRTEEGDGHRVHEQAIAQAAARQRVLAGAAS